MSKTAYSLDGLDALGNAVVERAVWDYRIARYNNDPVVMKECEEFFVSDRFKYFSNLDGEELLEVLKHEPRETMIKLLKSHMKLRGSSLEK